MSNGFGSFSDWYPQLPYQWPLAEVLPVVRIPIAGPEPYNTLVVVRTQVLVIDQIRPADGQTHHARLTYGTAFSLAGFDPRIQPAFDYSAAVSLQMLQSSGRTTFICAVDTVCGAFDENGRWTVTVDVASEFDHVKAAAGAYVSSWVLCYEPPIDLPRTPGKPRQQGSVRQQTITNIAALAHT